MSAPSAADYAAALALVDADISAADAFVAGGGSFSPRIRAALAYVRARLAADVALELYIEHGRDTKAGVVTTDRATWAALDEECERADKAALAAYRAFVALAANADGAP